MAYGSGIEAASVYVSVGARGVRETIGQMGQVSGLVDRVSGKEAKVRVAVPPLNPAIAQMEKLKAKVTGLDHSKAVVKVDADTKPAEQAFISFRKRFLGGSSAGVGSGFSLSPGVIAAGAGIAGLVAAGAAALKSAGQMETFKTQLSVLLGSEEAATKRMAELTEFAKVTPFELPQVVAASKTLQVFTGDVLSTGKGLQLVGDVAAGTGSDIGETSMWFGRLYDAMQSGRPFGEATQRLQEMGAISGASREKIEGLAEKVKSGAMDMKTAWAGAAGEFSRFGGMMEKQSATFEGKLSNLSDSVGQLLAKIGGPLIDVAKPVIDALIAGFTSLADFLGQAGKAATGFMDSLKPAIELARGLIETISNSGPVQALAAAFKALNDAVQANGGWFGVLHDALASIMTPFAKVMDLISEATYEIKKFKGEAVSDADEVRHAAYTMGISYEDLNGQLQAYKSQQYDASLSTVQLAHDTDKLSSSTIDLGAATKESADRMVANAARVHEIALNAHQSMIDAFSSAHTNMFRAGAAAAGAFADGMQQKRDDIDNTWAAILEGLKHPMTKTKEFALDAGRLASKELARGLRSGDSVLRHESEKEVGLIIDRLNHLATQSGPIGKKGMAELIKAMHSKVPEIRTAATAIYNTVAGPKVQSDFAAGGQKVGDAWVTNVAKGIDEKAYLVRQAEAKVAKTMIGFSPPKEGPLHTADIGGFNIGKAWADYLARGVATAPAKVAAAMSGIHLGRLAGPNIEWAGAGSLLEHGGAQAPRPGASAISGGGSFHLHIEGVQVLTPGAAKELGDRLAPHVLKHMQRRALLPITGTGQFG